MTAEPVEIRRNPGNPRQGAYRTGPGVTAGEWFVFDADNGGSYSDGQREGVADWTVL
jgi:hypothetical protein